MVYVYQRSWCVELEEDITALRKVQDRAITMSSRNDSSTDEKNGMEIGDSFRIKYKGYNGISLK